VRLQRRAKINIFHIIGVVVVIGAIFEFIQLISHSNGATVPAE